MYAWQLVGDITFARFYKIDVTVLMLAYVVLCGGVSEGLTG